MLPGLNRTWLYRSHSCARRVASSSTCANTKLDHQRRRGNERDMAPGNCWSQPERQMACSSFAAIGSPPPCGALVGRGWGWGSTNGMSARNESPQRQFARAMRRARSGSTTTSDLPCEASTSPAARGRIARACAIRVRGLTSGCKPASLSICRSVIEAHDGQMQASTNEPRGAVFAFVLPAKPDGTGATERSVQVRKA